MEWGSGKIQERVGAFQSEEERGIKAGWSWTRENCGYETVRWRGSPQRFIRLHGLWWVDCILKCKKNKKKSLVGVWRIGWSQSRREPGEPGKEQFQWLWWLVLCVNWTGPQGVQIFCQTLLWVYPWRLILELVDWGKQISRPHVGGP